MGRSLGAISYMDTMEIVAFLARHAEFRPAPLEQLLSAYYQAWHWLRQDYRPETHLLSVFAYGRGNFGYINREREWQQTSSFFGKIALAQQMLAEALMRDKVDNFPTEIVRPDLARFQFSTYRASWPQFFFDRSARTPKPKPRDYITPRLLA